MLRHGAGPLEQNLSCHAPLKQLFPPGGASPTATDTNEERRKADSTTFIFSLPFVYEKNFVDFSFFCELPKPQFSGSQVSGRKIYGSVTSKR